MFGLSHLLPLETLPGWPAAPNPTGLETFILLLGIPFAVGAVMTAWLVGRAWFAQGRAETSAELVKK
ncbi:MAG: hypothetical protein HZY73_11895 [Micropruina sp.]|nr:MAG: hypothetical protein HZY73_11895 [Micropruina sp.]